MCLSGGKKTAFFPRSTRTGENAVFSADIYILLFSIGWCRLLQFCQSALSCTFHYALKYNFVDLKLNLALKSNKWHNLLKNVYKVLQRKKLPPLLMSGETFHCHCCFVEIVNSRNEHQQDQISQFPSRHWEQIVLNSFLVRAAAVN